MPHPESVDFFQRGMQQHPGSLIQQDRTVRAPTEGDAWREVRRVAKYASNDWRGDLDWREDFNP